MKTVTYTLYKFSELSDEARKKVVDENCFEIAYDIMDGYGDEYVATLEAFEKLFGCKVHYEVGYEGCRWWVEDFFSLGDYCSGISAKEIKGKYILRVINGFYDKLFPKKRYWGKFKWDENGKSLTKTRYSKIVRNYDGCPLTGVCYDCTILQPIMDFLKKPDMDISLMDLVKDCLRGFFKEWRNEYDYWCENKENCLEEEMEERFDKNMFLADGTMFKH